MILVTGASGTIGSALVRELDRRGAAHRTMSRRAGFDVVGDYDDPGSLGAAVDGVSAMFLLSGASPRMAGHDRAMVGAAVAGGVRRIVKLSAIGTPDDDATPAVSISAFHRDGDRAVRDSGLEWTVLRPTSFNSNTLQWAPAIRAGQPVANAFGDGKSGWIDPADIAAVAATSLIEGGHVGRTYTLTGPDLLSVPELVTIIGEVIGRTLTTADLPPDRFHTIMPPEMAEFAAEGAALIRRGDNAIITPDVHKILGRPPVDFRSWAEANRSLFA